MFSMKIFVMKKNKENDRRYSSASEAYTSPRVSPEFDLQRWKNLINDKNKRFNSVEYDRPSKSTNTPLEIQIEGLNNRIKKKGKSWSAEPDSGVLESF
jgi:hypothetical protein